LGEFESMGHAGRLEDLLLIQDTKRR
jgi:hypothetical protein